MMSNKYYKEAEAELKDAARSGRAFLQWEALRQIALNLARIADSLAAEEEAKKQEEPKQEDPMIRVLHVYELMREDDHV
jgi:hypothetical protein